jgi:hypothetical protein
LSKINQVQKPGIWVGGVAQVVEHEALSSNSSSEKKEKVKYLCFLSYTESKSKMIIITLILGLECKRGMVGGIRWKGKGKGVHTYRHTHTHTQT